MDPERVGAARKSICRDRGGVTVPVVERLRKAQEVPEFFGRRQVLRTEWFKDACMTLGRNELSERCRAAVNASAELCSKFAVSELERSLKLFGRVPEKAGTEASCSKVGANITL